MVRQFHDGMHALVQTDRGYSEPHGCGEAPTPFSMMFSDMLTYTFRTGMKISQWSTALMARQSA